MRRRLFVISNPGAGISHSSRIKDTMRALEQSGASLTHVRPEGVEAGRRAAREAAASGAYDAVVAAGGDGTIRHIASALIGTTVPLGIIPIGTGNVLAHEIGLKPEPNAIARMLLQGPVVEIACARANGEPFLLMAGAGFDAHILSSLDQRAKGLLGKLAYGIPLIGALSHPLDTLSVTVDQRAHQASWAVVANARHYGGGFVLAPRARIHQRGLEAILFKARSRTALMSMLMSLASGRLAERAAKGDVEILSCTHVAISAPRPVPVQIDGDVIGSTPLEIDSGSAAVQLIVPPEN
jgi:diacylglycerol kinase family enzyme